MVLKLGNISFSHPQKTHSAKKKLRSQERRQPDLRSDEETNKKALFHRVKE